MRPMRFASPPRDLSRRDSRLRPLSTAQARDEMRFLDRLPRDTVLGAFYGTRRDRVAAHRFATDPAFPTADGVPFDKASGLPTTLRQDTLARIEAREERARRIAARVKTRKARAVTATAGHVVMSSRVDTILAVRARLTIHHEPDADTCPACLGPCAASSK